jgi:hypothetical protein
MILLRKLVLVVCWACLLSSYSASTNAQNLDPVTGLQLNSTNNILNLGGGLPWNNTVTGEAGGTSGGPTPAYNPGTGNIIFSYASRTVSQTVAINQALANAGAGVQLSGYRYLWQINNDLNNYEGNRGTLTGNVSLKGATGNIIESFNYNYNQNLPSFTSFSGIQFFNNRYDIASASSLTVSFTGKDQNTWLGYYGPRVHVDSFNLLYTVDPCKLNPAYSSTCSGFGNIITTGNLAPNPDAVSTSMTQVVAINTALKSAGFGATIHGFNYKFDYTVGQSFFGCTAIDSNGWCSWWMNLPAYISASASITNSNNQTLISRNHSFNSEGTSGTVNSQLLLSTSMNQTSLGNIRLSGGASGIGSSIGNYSMSLIYTPDPCIKNSLYSPNCDGFAQAMAAKLSANNTTSTPTIEPSVSSATVNIAQSNSSQSIPQQTTNTISSKGSPQSKTVAAALSIIAKNQQREQTIQNSAVQTAITEAAAAGDKAQQQAISVASAAVTMSQTLSNASVQTQRQTNTATIGTAPVSQAQSGPPMVNAAPLNNENKSATVATTVQTAPLRVSTPVVTTVSSTTSTANDTQYSMISAAQSYFSRAQTQPASETTTNSPPLQPYKPVSTATVATVAPITVTTSNTPVFSQSSTDQQSFMTFAYVQPQNTLFYAMAAAPVEQPQQTTVQAVSFSRQAEIEQVNNAVGFMTNRTDPLNEVVESKPVTTTTNTTESTQTVKATVTDNELAGGVDINKMATTPVGYNNYTNLMLKDGKLYEPKEIYKNQVPVDNARALRQLSTDRLHQQMIEQQYRR